jgi:hypothetical protein
MSFNQANREKSLVPSHSTKTLRLIIHGAFLAVDDGTSHSAGKHNKEVRHDDQQS